MAKTTLVRALAGQVLMYKSGRIPMIQTQFMWAGDELVREHMPDLAWANKDTKLLWQESTPQALVFETLVHHGEGFLEWVTHKVIVRPSLIGDNGFVVKVFGKDKAGIQEFVIDRFHELLSKEVDR